MPARNARSPMRTSCSRRNDGPGGGSRSGTAGRIRGPFETTRRATDDRSRSRSGGGRRTLALGGVGVDRRLDRDRSERLVLYLRDGGHAASAVGPRTSARRPRPAGWRPPPRAPGAASRDARRGRAAGARLPPPADGVSSGYSPLIHDSNRFRGRATGVLARTMAAASIAVSPGRRIGRRVRGERGATRRACLGLAG